MKKHLPATCKILGLISDTHGLLRDEALRALAGCDLILHAGDVGSAEIIPSLATAAPTIAIRGNVDTQPWCVSLSPAEVIETHFATIYMLHDVNALDLNPVAAGFQIVVSGHSHRPGDSLRDGVYYINPGSAGPRRFQLPVTVARLDLTRKPWKVEYVNVLGGQPK